MGPGHAVPRVTVVIPLHRDSRRFRKILEHYPLNDPRLEVVVDTDGPVADFPPQVRHVVTGSATDTSPAVKRDAAFVHARGDILAYVDDDAYPASGWLETALRAFDDPRVAGIGGPGLTPPESPWRERLGGAVYESRLGSGPLRYRFVSLPPSRAASDLPAYNLLIRRDAIRAVGGWRSTYYGGEDTKLCLDLRNAGFELRYHPSVIVYHYRRPVFRAHMRQVGNVGRHRGLFVRRYAATSRRLVYFLPAGGLMLGTMGIALTLSQALRRPRATFAVALATWFGLTVTAPEHAGRARPLFPLALAAHHAAYGLNFLKGLFATGAIDKERGGSHTESGGRASGARHLASSK